MTVAETVEAIAETLMKCGKVKDMAEAFRKVTGRDFTGRIVGVNKDNLSYDMAREIKMQFERESFAALTVSEKITFLCERDAYDTGRFLTVCRVEELREIALSIEADTAGVRKEYEMAEKLDYISAIQEKLLFGIGYAQHQPAEEKGTIQTIEITQPEALYKDESYSDFSGDNSHTEEDIPESHMPEEVPATVKANQSEEKFLQCRSISAKTKEITAMLNKYAEISGTVRAIHDGIKIFRKGIKIRKKQGLPTDTFEKAIKEVREKYREWRIEGFKLRLKLLRVMSTEEIRRAREMYIARCERIRRRHMWK